MMETIQNENGTGENQRANHKEVEPENYSTINNEQNDNLEQVQNNAAHVNALKDEQNNVKVEKANENFDLLIRNAHRIDTRTKMLMEENKPLIRRIFPNKMDKLIAEMDRNTVHESMQFRLNLYKLNTQFMLEGLREKYDSGLKMIKAEYRAQVAAFMMSKLEGLSKDVQNRQYTFIQMVREKNQFLQTMSDLPSTAKRYSEQIEREQDRYFNFLEKLVINFENIIKEELRKFS